MSDSRPIPERDLEYWRESAYRSHMAEMGHVVSHEDYQHTLSVEVDQVLALWWLV